MLMTAREAAEFVGVAYETVRTWHKRGVLKPAARDPRGAFLYLPGEVLGAEAQTRRNDPTRRRQRHLARRAAREPD